MKKKTSHMVLLLVILSMLLSACATGADVKLTREDQIIYGMKGKQESGAFSGKRSWLGVSVQDLTDDILRNLNLPTSTKGVLVKSIEPGGPAEKAGLKMGDIIQIFDNKTIQTPKDLGEIVAKTQVAGKAQIILIRGKEPLSLMVTLGMKATPQRQSLMSVAEAKQVLRELLESHRSYGDEPLQNIAIRNDGFTFLLKGEAHQLFGDPIPYAETISFKFSDIHAIENRRALGHYYVAINGKIDVPFGRGWFFSFSYPQEKTQQFVDAVKSMKYHFSNQLISDDSAAFAEFQQKARAWRALPQRPAIPEELRRYRVQAEDAFLNKEFDKAIDYYEKGLAVYPLWPEGYFNAAYLCGEVGIYARAICHMKRYLELSPDAKDAQVSRDKMFVWEGKLGR